MERTYRGYRPFSYQKAVHNELNGDYNSGKIVVVKSRRQCGKSLMVENELLRYALNKPRAKSASVSPTLKQAKKMYREIVEAIVDTGVIKTMNATDLEIKLINNSVISFKSAEQGDALRGYTISGILCIDEACFINEDIFYMILPWCDFHKAPILITSTPKMKSGWFYEYYMRGVRKDGNIVSIDWCDKSFKEDLDKILTPDKLEEYRKMLPRAIFETEYLGEFVDAGGGVFNVKEWYDSFSNDYNDLYIGIDWATGENGDNTAICGFNERGEQVVLDFWKDIPEPMEQIRRLGDIIRSHKSKIKNILVEKNSIGDVYYKLLRQEIKDTQLQVTPFDTTNTSKRDIIEGLAAAIGEGNIKLQNNREQKLEFGAYQMEITKGGSITYNGSFGFNDDICIATALANKAKINRYGKYNVKLL